jgi:hypothetical protein
MNNIRLPIALCAAVADVLQGSHEQLNALFESAGAPGPPPELSHQEKWKRWLLQAGDDPNVDSLRVLGRVIEEFMDVPPPRNRSNIPNIFGAESAEYNAYKKKRARLSEVLESFGFRYYRGGRVLPNGKNPGTGEITSLQPEVPDQAAKPSSVEDLLTTLIHGLPRAMHPLEHRRKGAQSLSFNSEYDIQDLLHSQLRPWISDIRPEEYTPSYAGSSTRMDFLLPAYKIVLEMKRIRDKSHASKVGDELIIDIEHYRCHRDCDHLWCVIYDPRLLVQNPKGLISDLEGTRNSEDGAVQVKVFVFGAA